MGVTKYLGICTLALLFGCSEQVPKTEVKLNSQINNPNLIFPGQQIILPDSNTNDSIEQTLGVQEILPVEQQELYLINPRTTDFSNDSDVILLARLLFGESRGENRALKIDIGYSVINRTGSNKWWGNTLREVILKPVQYSCFNSNDSNYEDIKDPWNSEHESVWAECILVAKYVLENPNKKTNEATHYYSTIISEPYWAKGKTSVKTVQNTNGTITKFYKLKQ
ncbi:hypothetical protein COV11_04180 [Candidatus Woesearchaeota archaeon CG10_big_fil_rev_8_21_14_0_10_30_7]|nr:MAG: hypothetical protein COV11_04180 [Candidatus Woesearchaeota archaeon CG10_big_fil_rev_8_21_14_0_10_30_7]